MQTIKRVAIAYRTHETVARESRSEYLFFYWLVVGAGCLLYYLAQAHFETQSVLIVAAILVAVLVGIAIAARMRNWQLALDFDHECWRTEQRALGIFPYRRREWPIASHTLQSKTTRLLESVASESEGIGCLAFLLPFPLSLLLLAVPSAPARTTQRRTFYRLVLTPPPTVEGAKPQPIRIALFDNSQAVDKILAAFHQHAPDAVFLRSSAAAEKAQS
ncbi:MAG: hypothetical protein AAF581_05510 [Planctomycetota bacterium]